MTWTVLVRLFESVAVTAKSAGPEGIAPMLIWPAYTLGVAVSDRLALSTELLGPGTSTLTLSALTVLPAIEVMVAVTLRVSPETSALAAGAVTTIIGPFGSIGPRSNPSIGPSVGAKSSCALPSLPPPGPKSRYGRVPGSLPQPPKENAQASMDTIRIASRSSQIRRRK